MKFHGAANTMNFTDIVEHYDAGIEPEGSLHPCPYTAVRPFWLHPTDLRIPTDAWKDKVCVFERRFNTAYNGVAAPDIVMTIVITVSDYIFIRYIVDPLCVTF